MTSKERILTALALKQPDRVPFADDVDQVVRVKIMGRQDFTEAQFAKKLGLDAVDCKDYCQPVFSSAPVFTNWMEKDGRRYMMDGLIKTDKDLELMVFPDPQKESFYDPLKRFIEQNEKEDLAVYQEMRWGISGVLYSMGADGLGYALYENPRLVEKVLDRYVEWNCHVMERFNQIGLDFVITYDNIAFNNGPFLSPQMFREIFLPRVREVAKVCRIPWVCHCDGNIMPIIDDLLTLGMNGLHPIESSCMDLELMKERYGHCVCLWGNVDLRYALTRGTEEDVEEEVKQCIQKAAKNGAYILGSSNGLPDYCKLENIWAMAKAVKKYGAYPVNCI